MSETIFSYNPTDQELEEINPDYVGMSKDQYLEDIGSRAKAIGSSVDYELTIDLQQLFKIRGDQAKLNHYTAVLHDQFGAMTEKLFNE